MTLATIANMRRVPKGVHCTALDRSTGYEVSANPGDYWYLSDDDPLIGSDGEPMILVTKKTIVYDALTGLQL